MRVITAPTLCLLARPSIDAAALQAFLADHDLTWKSDSDVAAQQLCEVAGRVCYLSFASPRPGGNKAYLQHLLESGHGSVLEHAVWTFLLTGISRSLSHELVRHRHLSFSQLSQRYVDESEVAVVIPPALQRDRYAYPLWENQMQEALRIYRVLVDSLLDKAWQQRWPDQAAYARRVLFQELPADERRDLRKNARQAARSVLPNATETKIVVTGNARAWRGLLDQRASRHADAEFRRLAYHLWQMLVQEAPHLFGDYQETTLPDGSVELTTPYRKV